jgi:hypothetical protein
MELNVTFDTLLLVVDRLMSDKRSLSDLSPEESTFWLAWTFVAEVNNGGLHQFFFNHSGEFTHETVDALREVAAFAWADALLAGIACFASGHVSPDTMTRRRQLEDVSIDAFRPLEDICYSTSDVFDRLLITYVKSNMMNTILPYFVRAASDEAADQFRAKDYSQVVKLLAPFESYLNGATLGKLKFSRNKVIEDSKS